MKSSLTDLFQSYAIETKPPVLELQNIHHVPVAALYLDRLNYTNLVVSETNNTERYFIYIDGVGIYFSFFKKLNP